MYWKEYSILFNVSSDFHGFSVTWLFNFDDRTNITILCHVNYVVKLFSGHITVKKFAPQYASLVQLQSNPRHYVCGVMKKDFHNHRRAGPSWLFLPSTWAHCDARQPIQKGSVRPYAHSVKMHIALTYKMVIRSGYNFAHNTVARQSCFFATGLYNQNQS